MAGLFLPVAFAKLLPYNRIRRRAKPSTFNLYGVKKMSTRATYRFIPADRRFKPEITLYVHHDGYPEGAANYLQGTSSAEDFIRKNPRAEITLNHEVHEDTEYRYDIELFYTLPEGPSFWVKAYKLESGVSERIMRKWELFFNGSFDEFIEQNLPAIEYLGVIA
jgi:hypothetical protein